MYRAVCGGHQHDHASGDHGLEHGLPGLEKKVNSAHSIRVINADIIFRRGKYSEKLYSEQQEKLDLFSDQIATSSLTISFSTLFHFITIYFMLQGNV